MMFFRYAWGCIHRGKHPLAVQNPEYPGRLCLGANVSVQDWEAAGGWLYQERRCSMCTVTKEAPRLQWEAFVLDHIDIAYDVAYKLVQDSHHAEALVEKTLEAIWANPDALIQARHPKAKLLAILRNSYANHHNRARLV